jgi:dTDP-4-amino-4,6-dideoxygalactose transaminase
MNYKTNLRYKGDLAPEKVRLWIAREGTVEVAKCYALPWTREALFNPDSRPWVWSGLVPEMHEQEFPNATWFAERSMLIPHEYWLRPDAAEALIAVLRKVCRWHDHREIREWTGK